MARKFKATKQVSLFTIAGGMAEKLAEAVRERGGFHKIGGSYQRVGEHGRPKGPAVTLPMATMLTLKKGR